MSKPSIRALVLLIPFAACARPAAEQGDVDWVSAIVRSDPMFGGNAFFATRLMEDANFERCGTAEEWSIFIGGQRGAGDEQAADLVRELVPQALGRAVLSFFDSSAGRAMAGAETLVLTAYRHQPEDLVARVASAFSDPHGVGEAAVRQFEVARNAMAGGHSPSPAKLSIVIGAMRILPEQAQAIATFNRSATGKRWAEARQHALLLTEVRFAAFVAEARQRGLVKSRVDLQDIVLPRAEFDAPVGERRR